MTSDDKNLLIYQARIEMLKNDALGMQAANAHRQHCGNGISYGEEAFAALNQQLANLIEEIKNL